MPVAIFILVIMALLAAAIVQTSSRNNLSAAQEILSTRAFYAAESGASWGMSQLLFNAGGSASKAFSDTRCTGTVNAQTLNFSAPGLVGCSAALVCTIETVGTIGYYQVTSAGVCGAGQVQARRVIQVGGKNGL